MENESDIIIYQTNDGLTKVDVKFEGETELESTSAKYAFVPESRGRSYEITYYKAP